MPKVKQNIKSSSNVEQVREVKQFVKQNRKLAGAGEGIRTLDNLLGRYITLSGVAQIVNR